MNFRYFSDLHLEFLKNDIEFETLLNKISLPMSNEICILSGDIGNPYSDYYYKFMKFINNNFIKTFVIAGNHEYYNTSKTI
jgi:DNA repair exonuclease SbcCD nuclease subunit